MVFVLFVVLLGGLLLSTYAIERKRTAALRPICGQLGWTFYPVGDLALEERLASFHLGSYQGKTRNVLRGQHRGTEIAIFDYWYTIYTGKQAVTVKQTVVWFRDSGLKLPRFALRPEGIFHKVGGLLGYRDIDFDSNPIFSKTYFLRSDHEAATRRLFGPYVLAYFERHTGLSTEGQGDQLLFYRHRKQIDPDQVHAFRDEGFRVLEMFRP